MDGRRRWPAPFAVTDAPLTPPRDPADMSAAFLFGYDDTAFYLGAVITDDVHVQTAQTRDGNLWNGDEVEIWLDTNLPGDFDVDPLNGDDFQFAFSPGNFADLGAQAWFFQPSLQDAAPAGVPVAAQPRADGPGYTLEAAIPWDASRCARSQAARSASARSPPTAITRMPRTKSTWSAPAGIGICAA